MGSPESRDFQSEIATPAIRALLLLLGFVCIVQITGLDAERGRLSWFLFIRQDIAGIALAIIVLVRLPSMIGHSTPDSFERFNRQVYAAPLAALALALLCWGGHYAIFQDYDLTRDEQMANFDAWIYGHGRPFWALPLHWQGEAAEALNQMFVLPIGAHEGWVSNYLPLNALFRALIGHLLDPALANPLLAGVGLIALRDIIHRLWSGDRQAEALAMVLYLGSSQILFTGMTAYAMTGYLALNLVWLALFLRDRAWSHGIALLVGFVTTGWHQPVFHPMFVAPMLLMLLMQKRYRLLAFYGAGYAAIGLFWLSWPIWLSMQATHPTTADAGGGIGFFDRIQQIIAFPGIGAFWLVALNLLRFISWQHLLFLPLIVAGLRHVWRKKDRFAHALAFGLLLPLPIVLILLPYQGHGWGYRYLHGVMGNAILLSIYGWQALGGEQKLGRALVVSSITTFALLVPLHGWQARQMTMPYARINQTIEESGAQTAIIDEEAAPFASDLVINRPDLSNRPLRLLIGEMDRNRLGQVCGTHTLIVDQTMMHTIRAYFDLEEEAPKSAGEEKVAYCRSRSEQNR